MFCKYCGTQIPDDSAVCSSCGKQLAQPVQQPVMPPPAQGFQNPPPTGFQGTPPSGVPFSSAAAVKSIPTAKIIRISILAVLLLFFLPFMTVSCSGSKEISETYSGFELITTIGSSNDELLKESKKSAKPNIFVIAAFASGIAAAGLFHVLKDKKKAGICSAAAAGLLILARLTFRMYYGLNESDIASYIKVDIRWGMILTIAVFLINAVLCMQEKDSPPN